MTDSRFVIGHSGLFAGDPEQIDSRCVGTIGARHDLVPGGVAVGPSPNHSPNRRHSINATSTAAIRFDQANTPGYDAGLGRPATSAAAIRFDQVQHA